MTRFALTGSLSCISSPRMLGTICQERPNRSFVQPPGQRSLLNRVWAKHDEAPENNGRAVMLRCPIGGQREIVVLSGETAQGDHPVGSASWQFIVSVA